MVQWKQGHHRLFEKAPVVSDRHLCVINTCADQHGTGVIIFDIVA